MTFIQTLAASKKSTIFVQSSWNLLTTLTSCGNDFHQVSWRLGKNCGFFTNSQLLNESKNFLISLYFQPILEKNLNFTGQFVTTTYLDNLLYLDIVYVQSCQAWQSVLFAASMNCTKWLKHSISDPKMSWLALHADMKWNIRIVHAIYIFTSFWSQN